MTRKRALIQLELIPATVSGESDWVDARWQRADGTKGTVLARLRRKSEHKWYVARWLVDTPPGAPFPEIPRARIEAAANADDRIRRWVADGVKRKQSPRRKFKKPAARRLDDQFYLEVAAAYVDAVAHGLQPAKTLAADSDTPQGTVNRWIAEARQRGHLPQTTPGRVAT